MQKRIYTKLGHLTKEERKARKNSQRQESYQRSVARKKAKELGLPEIPKLTGHPPKSPIENKLRKNALDKFNRDNKTPEEREIYLQKERERKRKAKLKAETLDPSKIRSELLTINPNMNKHFLERYIKLTSFDYSNYSNLDSHHILPKSLFPQYRNCINNRVKIPNRLHLLAHRILVKLFPDSKAMLTAYCLMSKNNKIGKFHEEIRSRYKEQQRQNMKIRMSAPPWKNQATGSDQKRYSWILAKPAYKIYSENMWIGDIRLVNELEKEYMNLPGRKIFKNMIKRFRSGWNPNTDQSWLETFEGKQHVN